MPAMPNDAPDETGREMALADWLRAVLSPGPKPPLLIDYDFPSERHAGEYMASLGDRPESEVVALLRHFLFPSCSFPLADQARLAFLQHHAKDPLQGTAKLKFATMDELLRLEGTRRLLLSYASDGKTPTWEGIRWILDLLPHAPRSALDALDAYVLAHAQVLPDGRLTGLFSAAALIRAKFIQSLPNDARSALLSLLPREFEHLCDTLYKEMGYETELTPPTRDGGRDIIATRSDPGQSEKVLVDCKLYNRTEVGYPDAMHLLGVVSHEPACRGVIVTTGHVTAGVEKAAPRIEVVGFAQLVTLLNEHCGARWVTRLDALIQASKRKLLDAARQEQRAG